MDSKSRATDITIIEPALIEIRDGRVFSPRYEDIYYSRGGSVDSYRVFLEPAKLVERMGRGPVFTVVEFGFGTGLNFVVTATEFLRQRTKPTRLRFVSFEKHPLTLRDLKRIGQTWEKSLPFVDQLWNQYPPAVTGWHRRFFKGGNIELSLYVGEVATGLRDFIERDQRGVDAWFLDGFSPDRNPAMWQESLLSRLHTRTRAGGTVTTFSSAGSIRRVLQRNGFHVERINSLPDKRHTLCGRLTTPRFKPRLPPSEAVVAGAGLAGCAAANALAKKGINVTMLDPTGKVARSTSSVPSAITHVRLSDPRSPDANRRVLGYTFSVPLIASILRPESNGVLQLQGPNTTHAQLLSMTETLGDWVRFVRADQASDIAGTTLPGPAVYFPKSTVVSVPDLCRKLISHPRVELIKGVLSEDLALPTVIATGTTIPGRLRLPSLEVMAVPGQIDLFRSRSGFDPLRTTVVDDGYVIPSTPSILTSGSTYEHGRWDPSAATHINRTRLRKLFGHALFRWVQRYRGWRCVTSDRAPIIGQASETLWLSLGYGSSATTSSLLAAETIASGIVGELPPIDKQSLEVMEPGRFVERQKRRQNPFARQSHLRSRVHQ